MSRHSYQDPLLVTLALDDASQKRFQEIRDLHFPKDRNIVPAHVTLFHALPAEELDQITKDLEELADRECFRINVDGVRFMGRGVMYELKSRETLDLQKSLASKWNEWLIPQDKQKFAPHIVVQNKVSAETARETFEQLSTDFSPYSVVGQALLLWRYVGGPWELLRAFAFKQTAIHN